MFGLRRAAVRVLSTPYTSVPIRTRSITTFTPSVLRASRPKFASPLQRRFASDEVSKPEGENSAAAAVEPAQADETPLSSDKKDQSAIQSAVSSATETASNVVESVEDGDANIANAAGANAPAVDSVSSFAAAGDPTMTNLYIGNLFFDVTEEDLKREFSKFGTVASVKIISDARGLSKGFGYVEFEDAQAAAKAVEGMNMRIFEGRRMAVQYTLKKDRNWGEGLPRGSPSKTLFIGNMSFEMSDQDLNDLFREIKNVIDVRVAIDRRTGQPRGFAHADFIDVASAEKAMAQLQSKQIYGRRLRIDFSQSSATIKSPLGRDRGGENDGRQ